VLGFVYAMEKKKKKKEKEKKVPMGTGLTIDDVRFEVRKEVRGLEKKLHDLTMGMMDERSFDENSEGKIYVCGVYAGRGRRSGAAGVSYDDANTSMGVYDVQGAIEKLYNMTVEEVPQHNHDDLYYRKDYIDGNFVHQEGDENIGGVKTFLNSPIVPIPTANNEAVNKEYVDNAVNNLDASMVHISGEEEIEGKKTMVGGCEIVGEDLTPTKPKGFTMVVDEGNNQLVFRVLYSDGSTLKIGSVSLS